MIAARRASARRSALAALPLAATVLLAACATPPPAPEASLGPWTSGRLSLRVEARAGQPAQSLGAAFELRGGGERGELKLLTPLGTQLAQARWQPGQAELTTADGVWAFDDLDALAERALGERVPLAALPDWLAGRPWPAAAHAVTAVGFDQLGWSVDLSRQAEGRIAAARAAPPVVSLRVLIDRPSS